MSPATVVWEPTLKCWPPKCSFFLSLCYPEIQSWRQRNTLAPTVLAWKHLYRDNGLFLMVTGKEQKNSKAFCSPHHVSEVCVTVFFLSECHKRRLKLPSPLPIFIYKQHFIRIYIKCSDKKAQVKLSSGNYLTVVIKPDFKSIVSLFFPTILFRAVSMWPAAPGCQWGETLC